MRLARRLDPESLALSPIFKAWLRGSSALDAWLPRRPVALDELVARIESMRRGTRVWENGEEVTRAIRASLGPDLDEAQRVALDALGRSGTIAIVTGQQPCLFGGPLYVAHKVATALALAHELRRAIDAHSLGVEVVTVFWNHDEDHDWGEANHVALVNPALDIQRVRLRLPSTGHALAHVDVAAPLDRAVDEARDLVVQSEAGIAELDALRPTSAHETLAASTTRLLSRHFGDQGLLVLEPSRLPQACRDIVRRWHGEARELRNETMRDASELANRGFESTVDPEQALSFAIDADGRRRAVPDHESCPDAARPSPGVLLRSVWQDHLLPTLAYVAGPGEVAYLALTGSIYRALDVERPLLVPRASMVHADGRTLELLERFGIEIPDLSVGARELEARIAASSGEDDSEAPATPQCDARIRELAKEFRARLRALEVDVARIDAHLVHPLHRIGSKASSELERFADKVKRQRRNRGGLYRQHARRLCAELFPRGAPQERVLPMLPFVARFGSDFARALVDVADPFETAQLVLEWGR